MKRTLSVSPRPLLNWVLCRGSHSSHAESSGQAIATECLPLHRKGITMYTSSGLTPALRRFKTMRRWWQAFAVQVGCRSRIDSVEPELWLPDGANPGRSTLI